MINTPRLFNEVRIVKNTQIASGYYLMSLELPLAVQLKPGQFLNIYTALRENLLPRPFSIFDAVESVVSILYKIKGRGTVWMSGLKEQQTVRIMLPLGNFFQEIMDRNVCLAAGGIGIAPVYYYISSCMRKGANPSRLRLFYGALSEHQLLFTDMLQSMKIKCFFSTDDGSFGTKGTVLNALSEEIRKGYAPDVILSCGPRGLLRALSEFSLNSGIEAYISAEENMGCGFGACVGCAVKKRGEAGYNLVCKDGPVFNVKEVEF